MIFLGVKSWDLNPPSVKFHYCYQVKEYVHFNPLFTASTLSRVQLLKSSPSTKEFVLLYIALETMIIHTSQIYCFKHHKSRVYALFIHVSSIWHELLSTKRVEKIGHQQKSFDQRFYFHVADVFSLKVTAYFLTRGTNFLQGAVLCRILTNKATQ